MIQDDLMYDDDDDDEDALTVGQPLHWALTCSAMTPTADILASSDATTLATSFPATSHGPTALPTNVRLCLAKKQNTKFKKSVEKGREASLLKGEIFQPAGSTPQVLIRTSWP